MSPLLKGSVTRIADLPEWPFALEPVGIQTAWERTVDLVTGPAANTLAGVALVHELTKLPALDLLDTHTHGSLRQRLAESVGSRGNA